jgi:hypothetical protein
MAARTPSTYATSSSRIADGSVAATVEVAGFAGVVGIGGVARVGGDEGIDGLGAVQAVVVGLAAAIGGRGVAPSVIHDLLMWATALTFSIRSTYRHSVARLERFLTQDRRASAANRATGRPWHGPVIDVERVLDEPAARPIPTRRRRPHGPGDPDPSGTGLDTPPCPTLR